MKKIIMALVIFGAFVGNVFAYETTVLTSVAKFTPHNNDFGFQESPSKIKIGPLPIGIRIDSTPIDNVSYGAGLQNFGKSTSDNIGGRYSSGNTIGGFVSVSRHFKKTSLEIGLYVYKTKWTTYSSEGESTSSSPMKFAPMVGIKYQITEKLSIGATAMHMSGDGEDWKKLYKNNAYNISFGYKIKF